LLDAATGVPLKVVGHFRFLFFISDYEPLSNRVTMNGGLAR
jgi:hypothetical protein